MSRLDRHTRGGERRGRAATERRTPGKAAGAQDLPPRRVKHPSNKIRMTNWFYNSLIVLFVALVIGLFYYGSQMSGR